MKTFKKILLTFLVIFVIVFANGCYYVFNGQFKSMDKIKQGKELSLYECCSIYTINTAGWFFGWILSPEAAEQCLLMQFAKTGSCHSRIVDISNSKFIQEEIVKHTDRNGRLDFTLNFPLNEITSNKASNLRKELRYALAYDGARAYTIPVVDEIEGKDNKETPVLEVDVKYDKYTALYNVGPFKVTFNWQLLNYIQTRGWLHTCKITYWI